MGHPANWLILLGFMRWDGGIPLNCGMVLQGRTGGFWKIVKNWTFLAHNLFIA
jgi:hypothetical protein